MLEKFTNPEHSPESLATEYEIFIRETGFKIAGLEKRLYELKHSHAADEKSFSTLISLESEFLESRITQLKSCIPLTRLLQYIDVLGDKNQIVQFFELIWSTNSISLQMPILDLLLKIESGDQDIREPKQFRLTLLEFQKLIYQLARESDGEATLRTIIENYLEFITIFVVRALLTHDVAIGPEYTSSTKAKLREYLFYLVKTSVIFPADDVASVYESTDFVGSIVKQLDINPEMQKEITYSLITQIIKFERWLKLYPRTDTYTKEFNTLIRNELIDKLNQQS